MRCKECNGIKIKYNLTWWQRLLSVALPVRCDNCNNYGGHCLDHRQGTYGINHKKPIVIKVDDKEIEIRFNAIPDKNGDIRYQWKIK